MKKLFFFAAAALSLAACTSEELNVQNTQQAIQDNAATVNFDVYALRGVTRAGSPNDITNDNIKGEKDGIDHSKDGFGVFAYYTDSKQYSQGATPNFMYNQQVLWDGSAWKYEPVKYWPNEYGDAAISDDVDYVTFFAYAPWTKFAPTTGKPVVDEQGSMTDEEYAAYKDKVQNYNILEVKSNSETGDPIVKYRVDTDPATSVDLLWGVNADDVNWKPIDASYTATSYEAGLPFIDLIKPAVPTDDEGGKIKFNLRHALAKVKVTIDYIADAETPGGSSKEINADETRIYVRWVEMSGFALEGALNLNNEEKDIPLWRDIDGVKDLNFSDAIIFNDGRKDGREGTENGRAKEANMCLNPDIVENWCALESGKFGTDKTPGVTKDPVLLFGGDETKNGGYFYVIPRQETGGQVDVTINYGVLTLDPNLNGTLAGTKDLGSEIENQIYKEDIFSGLDFEAGKQYEIKIHIGMTSVKIEAVVEDWVDGATDTDVDLPDNQPDGVTPGPAPAPAPATVAEALAATPAITSFKYTLVGGTDADVTGTLTTETTDYTNTSNPSLNGTYYKFMRSNGTNYVWVRGDAAIDGTTANTILGQSGTSVSDAWKLKLAPAE